MLKRYTQDYLYGFIDQISFTLSKNEIKVMLTTKKRSTERKRRTKCSVKFGVSMRAASKNRAQLFNQSCQMKPLEEIKAPKHICKL
jgi:hypothetical protein